jgi:hypothetical protein
MIPSPIKCQPRPLIIATTFFYAVMSAAQGADFYDFTKGPDGGIKQTNTHKKIIDFINVADEDLIAEAHRQVKNQLSPHSEKIDIRGTRIVKNKKQQKAICGEISLPIQNKQYTDYHPFSYGAAGLTVIHKIPPNNFKGEIGQQIQQHQKKRKQQHKANGC